MLQLTGQLEEHHLFSLKQHRFKKGRSACDLLLSLTKAWHDALDACRPSLVIVIDISGTFDQVRHRGPLAKLEQDCVTEKLLEVFSSYLQDPESEGSGELVHLCHASSKEISSIRLEIGSRPVEPIL